MMLLYHEASFDRRLRRQLVRRAGGGFRSHPLLALALLAVIVALAAAAAAVLLVLLLLVVGVLAVGAVGYGAGRALLRPYLHKSPEQAKRPQIGLRSGVERYLTSVDEFAALLQTATGIGTAARPGDRRLRRVLNDCRRLQASLRELARYWRGPDFIEAGIYELEDATIALGLYLKQLTRSDTPRPPAAVLRSQTEALSRRLDAITLRLRRTDFRSTFDRIRA